MVTLYIWQCEPTLPYIRADHKTGTIHSERQALFENDWPFLVAHFFQWDTYKELQLAQDAAPPYFVNPVHAWLDNQFSGWWIGLKDQHNGLCVIYFGGVESMRKSNIQNLAHRINRKNKWKVQYFGHFSSLTSGKMFCLCLLLFRSVCKMLALCANLTLNASEWTFKVLQEL